jgi:hypothetical protein
MVLVTDKSAPTVYKSCQQPTLCIISDAIASFLEVPDHTTVHMGPVSKTAFESPKFRVWTEHSTLHWDSKPQRWIRGPSRRRWLFTISSYDYTFFAISTDYAIAFICVFFLYIAYSGLLTCMLISDKWSRFATERKTVRVTHPSGIQCSTFFLSLPYK